jgi:integrase
MASIFRRKKSDGKRSRLYSIKYKDEHGRWRRVQGYVDKEATKQLAAQIVRAVERRACGLIDENVEQLTRPIEEHLRDYGKSLGAKGDSSQHVHKTCKRITRVVVACGFGGVTDIKADRVAAYLHEERVAGRLGIQTTNYYLTAIKGFCRWLVRNGRIAKNPLEPLSASNPAADVRLERRALTADEFGRLVATTQQSAKVVRDLSGVDRAMLYIVAASTGLRASELASLSPASFDLDSPQPSIVVEAAYSKRRRRDTQPLPRWLSQNLSRWFEARRQTSIGLQGPTKSVWGGRWKDRSAEMLRVDLAAAGIAYQDDAGRIFDFHALRHQFISSLAANGVHPKVAQQLARHSTITLTMDRYTHLSLGDVAGVLNNLPAIAPPKPVGATEPDSGHHIWHHAADSPCPTVAPAVVPGETTAASGVAPQVPFLSQLGGDCLEESTGRGGTRTRTSVTGQGILSPQRLPFRHSAGHAAGSSYRSGCVATI